MDPGISRLLERDQLVAVVRQELISEFSQRGLRYAHEFSERFAGRDGIVMALPVPVENPRGFDSSTAFVIRVVKHQTRDGSIPFIRIWRLGAARTAASPKQYGQYTISKYPDIIRIPSRTLNDYRVDHGWEWCSYDDMVTPSAVV